MPPSRGCSAGAAPSPGRNAIVATTSASPSSSSARACCLDHSIATTMSWCTGYFMGRYVPANRVDALGQLPVPPRPP